MHKRRLFTATILSSFCAVPLCAVPSLAVGDDAGPVRVASLPAAIDRPAASLSADADVTLTGADADSSVRLTGRRALRFQIEKLSSVLETLDAVPGYQAEMMKQERVGGDLTGEQKILLKYRHANEDAGIAESVYMKWRTGDRGREVIYVDGANNGRMLVHAGGWKARILPVLALDPNGSLAMNESRHPITEAGLRNLTEKWLEVRTSDLRLTGVDYKVEPAEFDGHAGLRFKVEYASRAQHSLYRKCELWIDTERNIPLAAINYTWSVDEATDAQTLIERYEYRDVQLDAALTDTDFDRSNREYAFRK